MCSVYKYCALYTINIKNVALKTYRKKYDFHESFFHLNTKIKHKGYYGIFILGEFTLKSLVLSLKLIISMTYSSLLQQALGLRVKM